MYRASRSQTLRRAPPRRGHLENAPDRGRSPSAACRPAEADCKNLVLLHLAKRCEPGRFAVRRGQCRDARQRGFALKIGLTKRSTARTVTLGIRSPGMVAGGISVPLGL